jgi:hypothetical protein
MLPAASVPHKAGGSRPSTERVQPLIIFLIISNEYNLYSDMLAVQQWLGIQGMLCLSLDGVIGGRRYD